MKQVSVFSPQIQPVPSTIQRPLWSVMIPTYNCAEYLAETLASVLKQAPGPEVMQIVVVDNCSTDNTEAVVREIGQGRVEYFCQSENVGSLRNFQTCLDMAHGELVHMLHSDDCVCDGFYEKMARPFLENPELGAAFCRFFYINFQGENEGISDLEIPESGILPESWLERIATVCAISVPSLAVVRRSVYENLGGWDTRCGLSGDWEMWVRIFKYYPVWFETEPLAMWRRHSSSTNATSAKSPAFIEDNYQTVELILSYLPEPMRRRVGRIIKRNTAFLALGSAKSAFWKGDSKQALDLIKKALKYRFSPLIILLSSRMIWQQTLGNLYNYSVKKNLSAFSNQSTRLIQR